MNQLGDIRVIERFAWIPTFVKTNQTKKVIWLKEYKSREILEPKIIATPLGTCGVLMHEVKSWSVIERLLD